MGEAVRPSACRNRARPAWSPAHRSSGHRRCCARVDSAPREPSRSPPQDDGNHAEEVTVSRRFMHPSLCVVPTVLCWYPRGPAQIVLERPGFQRYYRAVSQDSLLGTELAGYTLQSLVGEGGTATVYRAQHPVHGTVAVKVLRERLRQDKTAVARFVREAQFGTRVTHPNVVRTIEIGEAGPGLHFLAIEWAKGEILDRYAKRRAPLPADEVVASFGRSRTPWRQHMRPESCIAT